MRLALIAALCVLSAAFQCPRAGAAAPVIDLHGARIVVGAHPAPLEALAARELQRYLGRIGAGRCDIVTAAPKDRTAVLLGTQASNALVRPAIGGAKLGDEGFVLKALPGTPPRLVVAAATPRGVLWAVYGLLERLGVGFYLGGDALAGAGPPQVSANLSVVERPAFKIRGSLPWYNFLDSPTTWDRDDYRYFFDQMAKMRMNLVGFHSYDSEPFCAYDWKGKLEYGEPLVTAHNYGWGPVYGLSTGDFGFGTGDFFFGPEFGSKATTELGTREEKIRRAQALLADGFRYARSRGLKVCLGFEVNGDPTDPEAQERLKARLTAMMQTYPMLDYVWIWQSEALGMGTDIGAPDSQLELEVQRYAEQFRDLGDPRRIHEAVRMMLYARQAHDLLQRIAPKTRMILSGWGGDHHDRFSDFYVGLDKTLPRDIIFSALDNIEPPAAPAVSAAYGKLAKDRERWPIPWWESDGGPTRRDQWSPQCNTLPFVPLCRDAYAKGCQGLLAIHWRTRDVEEPAAFQAQFSWNPKLTYEQFYDGFARRSYGARYAKEMGAVLRALEALGPRYTGTYGQVECGGFQWLCEGKPPVPANLDKLAALRKQIAAVRADMVRRKAAAGLERIDWLLSTIDWLTRYDAAAVVLRPGGEMDKLLAQAETAVADGDRAKAAQFAADAAGAFRKARLAEALRTFPWKMTTYGEWGSLATINVKAYAAYRRIADRIRAAGGDPGEDDRTLPQPAAPRIVMRTPPSIVEPGKPVAVEAIVIGAANAIWLRYRACGGAAWHVAPMRNTFRGVWSGTIPESALTSRGVEYRVEADRAVSATWSASVLGIAPSETWAPPVVGRSAVTACSTTVAPDYEIRLDWRTAAPATECMIARDPAFPGGAAIHTRLTEYSDVQVEAGETYHYTIETAGLASVLRQSQVAMAQVPRFPPPPAPTGLTARPAAGKVRLTWDPAATQVRGYRVYRARVGEHEQPIVESLVPVATFLDVHADPGAELFYSVTTVDRGGQESKHSTTITAASGARPAGPSFYAPLSGPMAPGALTPPARFAGGALDTRSGGWLTFPHQPAFEVEGEFAVSFWFRADATDPMPVIASCGEFQRQGWFVQILGGGIRFSLGNSDILDAGPVEPHKWYHLACTYDADRMHVYINGVEMGSRPAPAVDFRPWTGPLYVGQYSYLQDDYQFRGLIRDLRIYAYAPTGEEIAREAAAGAPH